MTKENDQKEDRRSELNKTKVDPSNFFYNLGKRTEPSNRLRSSRMDLHPIGKSRLQQRKREPRSHVAAEEWALLLGSGGPLPVGGGRGSSAPGDGGRGSAAAELGDGVSVREGGSNDDRAVFGICQRSSYASSDEDRDPFLMHASAHAGRKRNGDGGYERKKPNRGSNTVCSLALIYIKLDITYLTKTCIIVTLWVSTRTN